MNFKSGTKASKLFVSIIVLFGMLFFCFSANADAVSMLEEGRIVNAKMKSVAAGSDKDFWADTNDIKAIHMAESLPDGFIPSECNTVSTSDSDYPIYIFFDHEKDDGILFFYSESDMIEMNSDSRFIFSGNKNLTDISGVADWDTAEVKSFTGAFKGASSLSNLVSLSNWNTSSVSFMGMMFADDISLTDISSLANWDTSNVTDMYGMFSGAKSLSDALALRDWDTSNVTDMSFMFSRAISLSFIDVSNWNTSKVTNMASMFQVGEGWTGNGQLREILGLGELDVSNVTDMTCMFYGAGQMQSYDIAGWNVSKVESMNHMFGDNFKLRSLDLSGWDVSNVQTIYCMFDDNVKLKTIGDVSHWNTASLIDAGGWLNEASSFVGDNNGTLDLSGWDTSNLKSAGEMFLQTKLHTIDLTGWTFNSMTNELWEGANTGIFYETGNDQEAMQGFGAMFMNSKLLTTVYVSQAGLDSYKTAVENGVNTLDMWTKTKAGGFTVK